MGRLVVNNAMTVNGAFEAPAPEPDGWLLLAGDSNQVLEQFLVADAMVLGRTTYERLAAVWPQLADDPGEFADRMNKMSKYVASRTLREPLGWNASLVGDDLAESVTALKERHDRTLVAVGAGAHPRPDDSGSRGRVLVLGEPVAVADRAAIFDGVVGRSC